MHQKCEIIIVLCLFSFFSIAPFRVIAFDLLCINFGVSSLLYFGFQSFVSFFDCSLYSFRSFLILKARVGKAITISGAIQKRGHEPMYKTNTIQLQLLLLQSRKNDNHSNMIEKNIFLSQYWKN